MIYSNSQLSNILNEAKKKDDGDSYLDTVSKNIDDLKSNAKDAKDKIVKKGKDNVKKNLDKTKKKLHIKSTKEGIEYEVSSDENGVDSIGSLLEGNTITKDGYVFTKLSKKKLQDKQFMKDNEDLIITVDNDKYICTSGPVANAKGIVRGGIEGTIGGFIGNAIAGTPGAAIGGTIGGLRGFSKGYQKGAKIDRKIYAAEEFHVVDHDGYIVVTEADKPQLLKNGFLKIGSAILRPISKTEEKTMRFGRGVVFHGKRYAYQSAEDARDAIRHPAGAVGQVAGSVAGGAAGAVAGPVGSLVGSAAGGAAGKILGDAIDTTSAGEKVKKGYNKALDKGYRELKKSDSQRKAKKESFDFRSIYRSPEYSRAIRENFDLEDKETRTILLAVNEDDQTRVLVSLTSKLYDNIVDKVDDIDFGDIPATKGDITKLPNYQKLVDSIDTMTKLLIEYKQNTGDSVDVIRNALSNIIDSTALWKRAYALNVELPIVFYNTIVLSIIEATSYLIGMCVQYIKLPGSDSFKATIDKVALTKTKDHMIFENLKKFNEAYRKGQITKSMDYVITSNSKNLFGELTVAGKAIGIIALLFAIIPILRETIFLFYYERVRVSEYFDVQADMLQVNAYNVEHNRTDLTNEQKKSISTKQMKIATRFRSIANKIGIKMKESELTATKELTKENKKYQAKEVLDELPDSASSALF